MTKLLALSAAALLAFAPAIASAESPLTLNSTKSSGNLNAGVGDDVVVVNDPVAAGGINPFLLAGAGLLAIALIASGDDDDAAATSSTGN